MSNEKINVENVMTHWINTSNKDYETMLHLFESRDYHWSLFMGHLVVERLLKASVVKATQQHAPFTHDLLRLATLAKLEISDEQKDQLDTITTFNLNARYDDYKQEFYRLCTEEYAEQWISIIQNLQQWIKQKL